MGLDEPGRFCWFIRACYFELQPQVSTTSHKGTLGLLPAGKKGRQKFVVSAGLAFWNGNLEILLVRDAGRCDEFRFLDLTPVS